MLVNVCLTQKINIQRGLKQVDPLAPFLFLLVAEGLTDLITRVKDIDLYSSFTT